MRDRDEAAAGNGLNRREALHAGLVGAIAAWGGLARATVPLPIALEPSSALTQGGWARGRSTGAALTLDGAPIPLAPDGSFLIAFDRDAGPTALLRATLRDGTRFDLPLTIAPRAWQIEHVNTPLRPPGTPSAEFARRRPLELARINAARGVSAASEGWRQAMIWPAFGRLSGRFGSQRFYQGQPGAYHSGLDIAAGQGTAYVAPADGVVVLAAQEAFTLEGHLLIVDHGMGLNSAFLHSESLAVAEGDTVRQGQFLGRVGMTGRATGPHLHWAIKWRAARLDPLLFPGPMRS